MTTTDHPTEPTTHLARMLSPGAVVVDVDAPSRKRVFEDAAALFENQHGAAARDVLRQLFEREKLGSTALGCGVAIPHARVAGLESPLAAVLRLRQPIPFDAPDDEPVWLLIFMLVPQVATQAHLEALAEIAQALSDRPLREQLRSATESEELYRALVGWQPAAR